MGDDKRRLTLADQAERLGWTSTELEKKIRRITGDGREESHALLKPRRGKLRTYQLARSSLIQGGQKLLIDLGFSSFVEVATAQAKGFKEGEIIEAKGRRLTKLPDATAAHLFTYEGYTERVIDGDTVWMRIDLGFGVWTRQKLRLRGIDAPEITTKAGQAATRFLEATLKPHPSVILTTSKSDKFDRYLTDLYAGDTYVNQFLITKGHASRVSD